ncbi:MAG: hypothetical protein GYB64_01585, partial [Chloroflexi bacterium]|nr:hypothetical protein [Chloroflexota bacterium]
GVRIELLVGGSLINKTDCAYTVPGATFTWTPFVCFIGAPRPYDEVRVTLGAQGTGSGFIGFDSVFLFND